MSILIMFATIIYNKAEGILMKIILGRFDGNTTLNILKTWIATIVAQGKV